MAYLELPHTLKNIKYCFFKTGLFEGTMFFSPKNWRFFVSGVKQHALYYLQYFKDNKAENSGKGNLIRLFLSLLPFPPLYSLGHTPSLEGGSERKFLGFCSFSFLYLLSSPRQKMPHAFLITVIYPKLSPQPQAHKRVGKKVFLIEICRRKVGNSVDWSGIGTLHVGYCTFMYHPRGPPLPDIEWPCCCNAH